MGAPDGESSDAEVSSSSQTIEGIHEMVVLLEKMISVFLNQRQREHLNTASSSPNDVIQLASVASSSQSELRSLCGSITGLANSLGGLSTFCASSRHSGSSELHSSLSNLSTDNASSTGHILNCNEQDDGSGSDDESGGITSRLRKAGILPRNYAVSKVPRREFEGNRGHRFDVDNNNGDLEYSSAENNNSIHKPSKAPELRQRKPKKAGVTKRKSGKIN